MTMSQPSAVGDAAGRSSFWAETTLLTQWPMPRSPGESSVLHWVTTACTCCSQTTGLLLPVVTVAATAPPPPAASPAAAMPAAVLVEMAAKPPEPAEAERPAPRAAAAKRPAAGGIAEPTSGPRCWFSCASMKASNGSDIQDLFVRRNAGRAPCTRGERKLGAEFAAKAVAGSRQAGCDGALGDVKGLGDLPDRVAVG